MSWNAAEARARIKQSIDDAPKIDVRRFNEYQNLYEARKAELAADMRAISPPLFDLDRGTAVLVNTVQIYIKIVNYDEQRTVDGQETEASHAQGLQYLHFYYSACDRVAEKSHAQRVDFHSSRMHAVVLDDVNGPVSVEALARAFLFVRDFKEVAAEANRQLANGQLGAEFRIGIDVGPCVAINNGTALEQEPLFLGSPANHAAKLADGNIAGVYLSDRARALLGMVEIGGWEGNVDVPDHELSNFVMRHADSELSPGEFSGPINQRVLLENWQQEIADHKAFDPTVPTFAFRHKEPPLSDIKFADLTPSKSIRMDLVSIYADLSGYTAYVDAAIGAGKIPQAVLALFVIREELQKVTQTDFGGRKVRFIGDCIHALIAEGSATETDDRASVASAFKCSGGLRSSFKICQEELDGIDELGLAIGFEIGPTPVSRIGIRGERSVRVASSRATAISEHMQKQCEANDIKLGPAALTLVSAGMRDLVNDYGVATEIDFDDVSTSASTGEVEPISAPYYARPSVGEQHYGRAHLKKT
jgi:class 3 adenylate cyclase